MKNNTSDGIADDAVGINQNGKFVQVRAHGTDEVHVGVAFENQELTLALEEVEAELGDDVDLFANITYGYD